MEISAEFLGQLVEQNRYTCSFSFDKVGSHNHHLKLNADTASLGFLYRHVGEMMLLLGTFLGMETGVENTTMGYNDTGQGADTEASRALVSQGYDMLEGLASSRGADWWMEPVETPFFGQITRLRLFAHILNHNAYHSGQMGLTLKRPDPGRRPTE
ncbi:DinB family protein [Robiginitalea sp. SC105]|uniref:DinB family protein n=1 Tax=Robiginitalea sp. SC105 TaxID=2762332 RepID=UPI00163AA063|nr:DinB family protein [Robiginitalea sp. SC105]MBC2837752.1 DinB family protein [Robiginitalea sp. SC105]